VKENSSITYREIYRQPGAFQAIHESLGVILPVIDKVFAGGKYDEVIFTGCGTSYYAAQSASYLFSHYTDLPSRALPCSEIYFFAETYFKNRKILVVPISRKSYTTEVRMAVDKARSFKGVRSLAVTCDPDSAQYNDDVILSPDANEESVIMTGSFTSMVYLSLILAMAVGNHKDETAALGENYINDTKKLLAGADMLAKKIVDENPGLKLYITLGQGAFYGIANECSNKMKEMGIVNSESYHSLEYRHGPMSLADANTLVLLLANPQSAEYERKLLAQLQGYGAVTAAAGDNASGTFTGVNYALDIPSHYQGPQAAALIGFIGQFLGYHISLKKNIDADYPRNLSQAIVL